MVQHGGEKEKVTQREKDSNAGKRKEKKWMRKERGRREWKRERMNMSVQKVSSHVIRKIETFIIEDTQHKKHCT